jgi:nuclear transport factor 2 (NTF2) superfamily protein
METRPPLPPFTKETATQKVRMAENGWNSRNPIKDLRLIPRIVAGAIGRNSSKDGRQSRLF